MKRKPFYEVYQGADRRWRWRQIAANGQKTAAQGEPSASKRGSIDAVITHARITAELIHDTLWDGEFDATDSFIAEMLRAKGGLRICPAWVGKSPHYRQPRWTNFPWIYGDYKSKS